MLTHILASGGRGRGEFIRPVSWKSWYRPELLAISWRNGERADAAVGRTGHVKSASLDFVVCERDFSEALDVRAQVAAKALDAVIESLSFRLGRALTAPARAVRSLLRRRPKS